jgi:hypothetical protein
MERTFFPNGPQNVVGGGHRRLTSMEHEIGEESWNSRTMKGSAK